MDVLLLEDVYNLGRAGEVTSVANGFGRNYLIPQGLAVRATANAVQMAEQIAEEADKRRTALNQEMESVADRVEELQLLFPARAGETGKLYGSVTTQMIADKLGEELGMEIDRRQIHSQPLRLLGMHEAAVRLTIDVIPEFSVVVYREGENPENYMVAAEELAAEASPLEEALAEEEEIEALEEEAAEMDAEDDDDAAMDAEELQASEEEDSPEAD